MCWGAGTALGELPPYFMARAARLSGYDPDDETETDLKELEELERKLKNKEQMTIMEKLKVSVEMIVERVGFLGILACASVRTRNPVIFSCLIRFVSFVCSFRFRIRCSILPESPAGISSSRSGRSSARRSSGRRLLKCTSRRCSSSSLSTRR